MHTDIYQWKAVGVGSYWVTLSLQIALLIRLYQDLDFIGVFICNTDLLVEICFGWTQRFSAGLKKDISEICNCRARVHRLENLPWSYWSHIDHWGEYLLIYFEEGHDYGKVFFLNTVKLLHCIIPEGCPHLIWILSNSKVCCLNLEADRVALLLQVGAAMMVGIDQTVQYGGEFLPSIILTLAQPNCWRHGNLVNPIIFWAVITMSMIHMIILDVGNDEFGFSQLSGVLDKQVASKINITVAWDVNWFSEK